jgi:hypothetical protein
VLPDLVFPGPPEPFAKSDLEHGCGNPLIEQPGTKAWKALLLGSVGGRDLGIVRACATGGYSEHKTGRAFDWGSDAHVPDEKARADALLAEILAPDERGEPAAIFRRLGLMYVIWDRQIWSVLTKSWQPYRGTSPHTDHVHFSFGWPGALAQTSYFQALGVAPGVKPTTDVPGPAGALPTALVALTGFAIGWYGLRLLRDRSWLPVP